MVFFCSSSTAAVSACGVNPEICGGERLAGGSPPRTRARRGSGGRRAGGVCAGARRVWAGVVVSVVAVRHGVAVCMFGQGRSCVGVW